MPDNPTPGELAYAAFTRVFDPQHVQWRLWPDVPRKMQLAWEAAAQAVLEADRVARLGPHTASVLRAFSQWAAAGGQAEPEKEDVDAP